VSERTIQGKGGQRRVQDRGQSHRTGRETVVRGEEIPRYLQRVELLVVCVGAP
jgi:hypothetical protein